MEKCICLPGTQDPMYCADCLDEGDIILEIPERNGYIQYREATMYVRRSKRLIEGKQVEMIDLANISREGREDNIHCNALISSTGFMSRVMDLLESVAEREADGVLVENVLNDFLPEWFDKRGYSLVDPNQEIPSFYWFTNR